MIMNMENKALEGGEEEDVLEKAMKLVKEKYPNASPQKKAAFANTVQTLVTGLSGGYGGPSVRELAACEMYANLGMISFQKATDLLLDKNGLIFGPIQEIHRATYVRDKEICFDDDPDDLLILKIKPENN